MLYFQYLTPKTNVKGRDRKMPIVNKPRKKIVSNAFDYLIALDLFSNWETFYDQGLKKIQDEQCKYGRLEKRSSRK